jgi:hypothetical protein
LQRRKQKESRKKERKEINIISIQLQIENGRREPQNKQTERHFGHQETKRQKGN